MRTTSRNPAFEIPEGGPPLLCNWWKINSSGSSIFIALNCTNFLEKCLQGLWVQTWSFGGALLLGLWPIMRPFNGILALLHFWPFDPALGTFSFGLWILRLTLFRRIKRVARRWQLRCYLLRLLVADYDGLRGWWRLFFTLFFCLCKNSTKLLFVYVFQAAAADFLSGTITLRNLGTFRRRNF